MLVARRSAADEIAAAAFIVDLGCLGVKSALASLLHSTVEYQELRARLSANQPLVNADLDLAAKVIREGMAYAGELGFRPDRDYQLASLLLEGADSDACPIRIPLGRDGRPYFIAGPYDDVRKITAQLTRGVGAGNFDTLVPLGAPPDWLS